MDDDKPSTETANYSVKGKQYSLSKGTIVTISDGKPLGSGGQGIVYKAEDSEGKQLAIKIFSEKTAINDVFFDNIKGLCNNTDISKYFVLPIDFFECEERGYVMEYVDLSTYKPISEFIYNSYDGKILKSIAWAIADIFDGLHRKGFYFADINEDDILVNVSTTRIDVRICDCDNISRKNTNVKADIVGKDGYIAPEVLLKQKHHSIESDLFSLSVLFFKLLVRNHPLEGKLIKGHLTDDEKLTYYGKEPLFIFDKIDKRNAPKDKKITDNWNMLPDYMKNIFERSFTDGLASEYDRPKMDEWVTELSTFVKDKDTYTAAKAPIDKKVLNMLFVVDVSGSMSGRRINLVNKLINQYKTDVQEYVPDSITVKIDVLTYGNNSGWIYPKPISVADEKTISLTVDEGAHTRMDLALQLLNYTIKDVGNNNNFFDERGLETPVIILLTDGNPTYRIEKYMDELKERRLFRSSIRIAFQLDEECSLDNLIDFTGSSKSVIKPLKDEEFKEVFKFTTLRASEIASRPQNRAISDTGEHDEREWEYSTEGAYTEKHKAFEETSNIEDWCVKYGYSRRY